MDFEVLPFGPVFSAGKDLLVFVCLLVCVWGGEQGQHVVKSESWVRQKVETSYLVDSFYSTKLNLQLLHFEEKQPNNWFAQGQIRHLKLNSVFFLWLQYLLRVFSSHRFISPPVNSVLQWKSIWDQKPINWLQFVDTLLWAQLCARCMLIASFRHRKVSHLQISYYLSI